jgi:hypothetical protein
MSHWETQGRLGAERRGDLDREAARESRLLEARIARASASLPRPPMHRRRSAIDAIVERLRVMTRGHRPARP